MDRQENVNVFWEQKYHSYQAARAYVTSSNGRNETVRIRMRNKHIPHDIPFSQLRTGTPTYTNPSVFGLEHEHAWEAAKLMQTAPKRKTAHITVPSDMLPARPYFDITRMTGVQKYMHIQGVLNLAMHFMQKDQGNNSLRMTICQQLSPR